MKFSLYLYLILILFCMVVIPLRAESPENMANKWSGYWEKSGIEQEDSSGDITVNESVGMVWIRIYQRVISSQDLPACVFHPSCSRFAMQAVDDAGLIRGILLSGDRLMRCNPFAARYYLHDSAKLKDPLEWYLPYVDIME